MLSLITASVLSACLCPDPKHCLPLTTPLATTETVAFATADDGWKQYDMDGLTTIIKFSGITEVADLICAAHAKGVRVAYSIGFPHDQLSNATAIANFAASVSATVLSTGMDGFNFDIEGNSGDAAGLTSLVKETSAALRAHNPIAQVSFDSGIHGNPATGYNLSAIAEHIDFFIPMAYDMCWGSHKAEPNSPIASVTQGAEDYMKWGLAHKTVLGVPWYGYDFPCASPSPSGSCRVTETFVGAWARSFDTAQELEKNATVAPQYTSSGDARFFSYELAGVTHQLYYDDVKTLQQKYDLVTKSGLRGVAMWTADFVTKNTTEDVAMWKAFGSVKKL